MKIATFGSCLSRFTALRYARMFDGQVVGSVYHNRVDRFVETYVTKEKPEIPLGLLGDYAGAAGEKAAVLIDNQFRDRALGKHGTIAGRGFMDEIEQKIDLVIMDNFVDIAAKLCHVEGVDASGLFIRPDEVPHLQDWLILEEERLGIDRAVEDWHRLIAWVRRRQKGTKIYFINFPFAHHPNPELAQRAAAFEAAFVTTRVRTLPIIEVHPSLVATNSHFDDKHYAMLAGYIWSESRVRRTRDEQVEDNADCML